MKKVIFVLSFLIMVININAQEKLTWLIPMEYSDCATSSKPLMYCTKKNNKADVHYIFNNTTKKFIANEVKIINTEGNGTISFTNKDNEICFVKNNNPIFNTKFEAGSLVLNIKTDDFIEIVNTNNNSASTYVDTAGNEIPKPTNFDATKYVLAAYLGYGNWAIKFKDANEDQEYTGLMGTKNCGILNNTGIVIKPFENFKIEPFINGLATVFLTEEEVKFIQPNGSYLKLPNGDKAKYAAFQNFEPNITAYNIGNKAGYILNGGTTILPAIYDNAIINTIDGNYYMVLKGQKIVVDKNGKTISKKGYEDLVSARSALTNRFIKKAGALFGFTDENNKIIIKPQFASTFGFEGNYAIVYNAAKKAGIINKSGNLIVPFLYDKIYYGNLKNGFIFVKNKKHGVGIISN